MKTIGLVGRMSWESTVFCYRRINELVRLRLNGLHAARFILGCTEIAMLVSPFDSAIPVFDTTEIHASSAVGLALGNQ